VKVFEGEKGIGMTERESKRFLAESRSTLLLGTTNDDGTPMIHPVWYYFDSAKAKIYLYTEPDLKKARNIKKRSQVYFDVDSDKWPYKGVKGKGTARLIASKKDALSLAGKILSKYVKSQPMTKSVLAKVGTGGYVIFEIVPAYLTSWDYGKLDPEGNKGLRDAVIS